MVDVMLTGSFSSFADGVLCLAFAADEKDLFVFADEVGKELPAAPAEQLDAACDRGEVFSVKFSGRGTKTEN